jgi:hypothetical protein
LPASQARHAPNFFASANRLGSRSVAITFMPASFSRRVNIRPIGPWPTTSTESPGSSGSIFTALSTVFTGSSSAPSRKEFSAGIFTTPGRQNGSTRTYSA